MSKTKKDASLAGFILICAGKQRFVKVLNRRLTNRGYANSNELQKYRRISSKSPETGGSNAKVQAIFAILIKFAANLHFQMHICISSLS
ncbi:MAG: hypothetical protein KID09_06670 [Paenibacillus macerans]|nr:hypothetical protein [Paenibacillus macerans]